MKTRVPQVVTRSGAVLARVALVVLAVTLMAAAPAVAEGPHWQLSVTPVPTHLPPGGEGQIVVLAWNLGGEGEGAPVTITDNLPTGVTATSIHTVTTFAGNGLPEVMSCSVAPVPTCTWSKAIAPFGEDLTPDGMLEMTIKVKVAGPPRTAVDEARIEGGEAPSASIRQPMVVSSSEAPFGFERYEFRPENADGSLDTQAGSHPFQMTTTLGFNSTFENGVVKPVAMLKNLHLHLPPGLLGNPGAVPECSVEEFTTNRLEGDYCPPETAVGIVLTTVREPAGKLGNPQEPITTLSPLFNLKPAPGEPARLGFVGAVLPIVLDTAVRTGNDYGVTISNFKVPETAEVLAARVTVWGFPGDSRHDAARGWGCLRPSQVELLGGCPAPTTSESYLTLPTSCDAPLESSVEADSWSTPLRAAEVAAPLFYTVRDDGGRALTQEGCDRLPFRPAMTVAPDTQTGSAPTGVKVDVKVPQDTTLSSSGFAEAAVRDTTVALPEGMQVNPASANGLEACSEAQVGFTGVDPAGTNLFTATLPEAFCPDGAKVGTVHIKTPLLPHELEGGVYLATQTANPFGSLIAMYIVAQDPESGVLVKLAGEVAVDEHTGRLTSTFKNTPELPFEELKLELFGGSTGPLSTPSHCGTYETVATMGPWSGTAAVQSSSSFRIVSGPRGTPCAAPLPFAPSLTAGSTNVQAAAFTPFTTTLSREDGDQNLAALQLHMPEGLLGKLSSVTTCPEPQASAGTCPAASLIGHTVVGVGLGSSPYTISGGQVFITGPYKGAPYGLSIAEPAKAGPFDLGSGPCDCVVVRAKIEVDPHSSALTITSDPLPTRLQGIPIQLKHANVTVDRPGFTFNPTNCSQMPITATISGEEGANAPASVPFEVANCGALAFKPTFSVSTQGKTSKLGGASIHVKVTSGNGQANIAKVRASLPKQLVSRLTTLQKACLDRVFALNPASCPAGSVVGTATAITPVLRGPLKGPAFLVSHAGRSFPDLVIVLQGEGITLDLVGNTDIKHGITSSTFAAVPDAPVSTFDLVLPEGPHSVLAANLPEKAHRSMCGQRLAMPTTITGQNGAVLQQTTKLAISGCGRRRTVKAKRKIKHRAGRKR
jgi:hypothetical protein